MSVALQLLLLAALSSASGGAAIAQTDDAERAADTIRPVKLVEVALDRLALERRFFGQVIAPQTVDLAFQVGGRLEKLPVVEGQDIAAGDLVAQLDLEPFERSLERARVELAQAQRNADRTASLRRSNTVSQVDAENAQSALELARLAYSDAQEALEDASLYAPFDAVVSARNVSNFTTVQAGTPIARLLDLHEIWINIDVPEILFRLQSDAAEENIEMFAEFPGVKKQYPLEFREYNAETSTIGQTYEVTLGMAPPDDQRILPGASVMVTIRLLEGDRDMVLPATALFGDREHALSVMVYESDGSGTGTVRRQQVDAAPQPGGSRFAVRGLEVGTLVVAAGGALLEDGQTVRRFQGFAQ